MAKNVKQAVLPLALEAAHSCGVDIWDVEFVREGGNYILRLYIDSPDGVSIDDCEAVSRAIDPLLDEADPIEQSYMLEVSSPGIFREVKTEEHYAASLGMPLKLKLYTQLDGSKELVGILEAFDGETVTIGGKEVPRSNIASARWHEELDF